MKRGVSAGLESDFDHIGLELAVSLSHLLRSTLGTKDFFLANAVRCLGSATLNTVADIKSLWHPGYLRSVVWVHSIRLGHFGPK